MAEGAKSDEEMKQVINRISTIKHWPKHFYLYPLSPKTWYELSGPRPLIMGCFTTFWCLLSFRTRLYYTRMSVRTLRYHIMMRVFGGFSVGWLYGMYQWGDLQRLNNAYVAERILRRYPESLAL